MRLINVIDDIFSQTEHFMPLAQTGGGATFQLSIFGGSKNVLVSDIVPRKSAPHSQTS